MTLKQIIEHLRISKSHMRFGVASLNFPKPSGVSRRPLRWEREAIENWLQLRRRGSALYSRGLPLLEDQLLKLEEVLELLEIGRTLWYQGVAAKRFPGPIKISAHINRWPASEIHQLIQQYRNQVSTA